MKAYKVGVVTIDGDTYCMECCAGGSGLLGAVPVFAGRSECYSCDACGDHLPHTGLEECADSERHTGWSYDDGPSPGVEWYDVWRDEQRGE